MKGQISLFDLSGERHGHWIKGHDNDLVMLCCTSCGCGVLGVFYRRAVGDHGFRYCPYCGAMMENPDEFNRPWRETPIWREWSEEEDGRMGFRKDATE